MKESRLSGLLLLLVGSVVFVTLGSLIENSSPAAMEDFKASYYSARCLVQHCDPYRESEVWRIYQAEGGEPLAAGAARLLATRYVYPPTAFSVTLPFAMLKWGPSHILWIVLTAVGLVFASFLAWNLGADYSPIVSGALAGFLLANSEMLLVLGNPSGIAISLCVIAVWCFLRERFVLAGILCLALSLALKPQDAGPIWLYFLLAGGVYRKRAMQTLAAAGAISLPAVLWVWSVAPHWWQELQSNILELFAPGGIDFPGPAAAGARGLINLQEFIGIFRDDPRIFNLASYLVCVPLLIVWALVTLRNRPAPRRACLALAVISPLSLLPIYHHLYDTKLLLLTVPACAILWVEGGLIRWLALLLNAAGFAITGDLSWTIFLSPISKLHLPATGFFAKILLAMQASPFPLILLVMSVFYLWLYVRQCSTRVSPVSRPEPLKQFAGV